MPDLSQFCLGFNCSPYSLCCNKLLLGKNFKILPVLFTARSHPSISNPAGMIAINGWHFYSTYYVSGISQSPFYIVTHIVFSITLVRYVYYDYYYYKLNPQLALASFFSLASLSLIFSTLSPASHSGFPFFCIGHFVQSLVLGLTPSPGSFEYF